MEEYVNAFLAGGMICAVGQVLIDKTKLTPARILVIFVVLGCVLGALGLYEGFAQWGGAGASVPIPGFGYLLWKGVRDEVGRSGALGILTGGLSASAAGISASIAFAYACALIFSPKEK